MLCFVDSSHHLLISKFDLFILIDLINLLKLKKIMFAFVFYDADNFYKSISA
ncbi:hypothetical protein J699_02387 [Acinetobacter sp. 1000160]|nr:hypothetical protein J699_02387 [Acinetobacter sp. 1000160]